MTQKSNLVGIMIEGNEELNIFTSLHVSRIHSDQELKQSTYRWVGEVHIKDVLPEDTLVVIDSWAYRARHQEKREVIRLRNGGYKDKYTNKYRKYKIMGIIRKGKLLVVVNKANDTVIDVAPLAPVRVTGVGQAHQRVHRFSSTKSETKIA